MELIELHNIFLENYNIILEIEDYNNRWHNSVRDWVENAVYVNQDDLSPNQFKEIEKIISEYEINN